MPVPLNLAYLKALNLAASREETRYYLNGVSVEIGADAIDYCATDGHILLAAHQQLDAADNSSPPTIGTWIIPSWVIDKFKLPTHGPKVLLFTKGERLSATLAQLGYGAITFIVIDGTFPSWRHVLPSSSEYETALGGGRGSAVDNERYDFPPEQLVRLDKAGRLTDAGAPAVIARGSAPAIVSYSSSELVGCIMPRVKKRWGLERGPLPAWVKAQAPHLRNA